MCKTSMLRPLRYGTTGKKQIECFFKLVKSAGRHLGSWQQESALAIAKRLLVAEEMVLLAKVAPREQEREVKTKI